MNNSKLCMQKKPMPNFPKSKILDFNLYLDVVARCCRSRKIICFAFLIIMDTRDTSCIPSFLGRVSYVRGALLE